MVTDIDLGGSGTQKIDKIYAKWTENAQAVGGGSILNAYLLPQVKIELITQDGNVTGADNPLLITMPLVKGKSVTTLTQNVTGSGVAQNVTVADSSVFTVGESATVDLNQGSTKTEAVTILAIPDGLQVYGIFTKNHTTGARIGVFTKGDKIGVGVAISDQAGNTDSLFGQNINMTATATGTLQVSGGEIDITNSTGAEPGAFPGDSAPYLVGMTIIGAGNNSSSVGLSVSTTKGAARFLNALQVDAAKNNALLVVNAGAGAVLNGISVQASTNFGLIIGSNQTAGGNPVYVQSDPTVGIRLTARGTTGDKSSNTLEFEGLATAVAEKFSLAKASGANGALTVSFNGSLTGAAIGVDGSVAATKFNPGGTAAAWTSGAGSPEGVITATVGSLRTRTDGGAGTTLYVKESGAGNTGWVAK